METHGLSEQSTNTCVQHLRGKKKLSYDVRDRQGKPFCIEKE